MFLFNVIIGVLWECLEEFVGVFVRFFFLCDVFCCSLGFLKEFFNVFVLLLDLFLCGMLIEEKFVILRDIWSFLGYFGIVFLFDNLGRGG